MGKQKRLATYVRTDSTQPDTYSSSYYYILVAKGSGYPVLNLVGVFFIKYNTAVDPLPKLLYGTGYYP